MMRQRVAVRIVPRSPVTVAIEESGLPLSYGVVANISEAGVCIWTDARLESGGSLHVRLSFPRGSQPLDAVGVVVWGSPAANGATGSLRYGVRWTNPTPQYKERLKRLMRFA